MKSIIIIFLSLYLYTTSFGGEAFLFGGEAVEPATGLSYNRDRYYDPTTGTFLTKDPLGIQAGTNGYIYVLNNPTNATDPLGLDTWTSILGGGRVFGGAFEAVTGGSLVIAGTGASTTGLGATVGVPGVIVGGAVAAHGLDTIQAGWRQMLSGQRVDSLTSTGLQKLGMSQTAANLTDAGIGVVGSAGAGAFSGLTKLSELSTLPEAQGLSNWQIINYADKGSAQLPTELWEELGGANTSTLYKGLQLAQGNYNSSLNILGAAGNAGSGLTAFGDLGVGALGTGTNAAVGYLNNSTSQLDVGGVLINQAATLVGANLSDIKGATYDPTTKQIVFLGSNNAPSSSLAAINMDYFYTAIQAVYGSATPPYVTLDPPASPASQWPYSQTFTNNSTQGFDLLYNPLWAGEDTTIAVRFRLTNQSGTLYDFTYNFNCVELNGTNGYPSISAGGRYLMGLVYSNTTGNPPPGLTLNTAPFQTGVPQSYSLTATSQTSYWPVYLTNSTGGNLVVNGIAVIPARQHREYGGRVDGTKLGWAMYEADRVMKCLAVGKDNLTGAGYSSTSGNVNVPGYKNLIELSQSLGDTAGGYNRMWFEPNDMTLQSYVDPVSGQATIGFQSSTVQLLTEAYLQGQPSDLSASAFATFFTNNYSSFATQSFPVEDPVNPSQIDNVPIFSMLQQAMQAVCLARFFHDNNIPLDNWWMGSYQPPVAKTPLSIATAYNEAPSGVPWYLIFGGVRIHKPNSYVPSSNAQSLGTAVTSARPASTSSSTQDVPGQVWSVNGTSQGNVTAVSTSLVHDYQDGNVNLAETDLSFASPGELPLDFTRYYQSSWIGTTNLGPGWRDVRYMLQFSAPSWFDQYHLLTDPRGYSLATATNGDTYLHSGTVRVVDLSNGSYLDFTSSLALTYGLNTQGNPTDTITGLNSSDLPTFTPGTHQSGATLAQSSGSFYYTATLPDGSQLIFDPNGNLLETIDRHGHWHTYNYTNGQLATIADDAGQTLILSYDSTSGLLTGVNGPNTSSHSNEETDYHYTNGLLTSVVNKLTNVEIAGYSYNGQNQLATVTRMDGTTPLATNADLKGRSANRFDINGNSTNYTYVKNPDGSRTTSALLAGSGLGTAQKNSDTQGRSTAVTDLLGHTTGYGYTGNSLLPNSVQLPTPGRPAIQVLRNNLGQPTTINDPVMIAAGAQPTKIGYDPTTNLPTQITDGIGRATNFYYTTSHNNPHILRRYLKGANIDVTYGYDGNDNLNSVQDPLLHSWGIGHDTLGRVTSVTDPTGVQSSCTYDQYGNLQTVTIPGVTIPGATIPGTNLPVSQIYNYDSLHRLTSVQTPTGTTTYHYDPVTQWLHTATQTDNQNNVLQTTTYGYNNSNGQVTSVTNTLTQPGVIGSTPVTTGYGYDSFGNVKTITPSGAQPLTFNYNAAGQLLGTSETASGPGDGPTILASNAASGVWTNINSQTMIWGAPQSAAPIAGYSYAEDANAGTTVNVYGTSLAWNNIGDGQHTFAMRAVDSAANWSPQSVFTLMVDTVPPVISGWGFSPATIPSQANAPVTVTVSVTDALSGTAGQVPTLHWCISGDTTRNWTSYAPMTNVSGNQWQFTISANWPLSGSKNLIYQAQAHDLAGNVATSAEQSQSIPASSAPSNAPLGWWMSQGSIFDGTPTDNWAVVNVGQLKNVATQAKAYLTARYNLQESDWTAAYGGVDPIAVFVPGHDPDNFAPATAGQLKFIASGFYNILYKEGYDVRPRLQALNANTISGSGPYYPWSDDKLENWSPVNIGQLKIVFSFNP
jgi:RHS repeat-associated protein